MIPQQLSFFDPQVGQRWTRGVHEWRSVAEGGFDKRRYRVREIPQRTARSFVTTHHYSRSFGSCRIAVGLFDGPHLVGVLVVGEPMHPAVTGNVFPTLDYRQTAEVVRLVLLDEVPFNAESWTTAQAFRIAAGHGCRGLVAFSDPAPRIHPDTGEVLMPGHFGTTYQACNSVYVGRSTPGWTTILPDRAEFSRRTARKILGCEQGQDYAMGKLVALGAQPFDPFRPPTGWAGDARAWRALTVKGQRAAWLPLQLDRIGARRIHTLGKHKFAWTIGDRGARRRTPIGPAPQPYPTTVDEAVIW